MKIQTPPGMRDFFPEDMRLREWLFGHWRAASEAFGFEPYDGPIFEFMELYTVKSGEEITRQLFHVRHGMTEKAEFAIRPEMTPTLARMVAARANALPRPIKWYSIPRLCRAERPQRGRLREFFQWNLDILGTEDALADAEIVAVAAELFRRVGVPAEEVAIRYSSRPLMAALLHGLGIAQERLGAAYALIDRMDKLAVEAFEEQWRAAVGDVVSSTRVRQLFSLSLDELSKQRDLAGPAAEAIAEPIRALQNFREKLELLDAAPYAEFDLRVVRGLAYYTGIVFEAYPRHVELRALLGGGRYDNLTELLGGPRVPGVGLGAGDAPLIEFLKESGRLPQLHGAIDVFVLDADAAMFPAAMRIVSALRRAGFRTDYSHKRQALGKQLKQAAGRNARLAVIVGNEFADRRELAIKNLQTSEQATVPADKISDAVRERLFISDR